MKTRILIGVLFAFSFLNPVLAGSFDYFHKSDKSEKSDRQLLNEAKFNLSKSIDIAEQYTKEKAVSAELEEDDKTNNVIYEVETIGPKEAHEVIIDAKTGKVLEVSVDKED